MAMSDSDQHGHRHVHADDPDEARLKALESDLVRQGYVDREAIDEIIDTYKHKVGSRNGAKVVARSWLDPKFRAWLKEDATAAIASLGYTGRQGEHMVVVENSPEEHNLVVCTLCSCYPWAVLGLPPTWYKSAPYRSRAVKDPRGVLKDFGVVLDPKISIRVWDSTAEVRYLVIPLRPNGTEEFSEEQLMDCVSRDAMVGTALAQVP
jgi:nitrile hydratase